MSGSGSGSATARLATRLNRAGRPPPVDRFGEDWLWLSRSEAAVFGLSPADLPALVALWEAYEAAIGLGSSLPEDIAAGLRLEHPWLARARSRREVDPLTFMRFAKLFGCSFRKAEAWYWKYHFWTVRMGIARYRDERATDEAVS